MALYLRAVAIRQAREKQLNGFVLTSNGNQGRPGSARAGQAGAGGVTVIKITEAQACARIAEAACPEGPRRAACDEGIKRRWFGRFQPSRYRSRSDAMTDET